MGRFPSELMTFEDFLLGYRKSVFYPPNPKRFRREDAEKLRLMVCPSACKHVERIATLDVKEIRSRVKKLMEMASEKADRVYIDFPAGSPRMIRLATALATECDRIILILRPGRERLTAAVRAWESLKRLDPAPELAAVVINMYEENEAIDPETGMRWEDEVEAAFGLRPTIIPFDEAGNQLPSGRRYLS